MKFYINIVAIGAYALVTLVSAAPMTVHPRNLQPSVNSDVNPLHSRAPLIGDFEGSYPSSLGRRDEVGHKLSLLSSPGAGTLSNRVPSRRTAFNFVSPLRRTGTGQSMATYRSVTTGSVASPYEEHDTSQSPRESQHPALLDLQSTPSLPPYSQQEGSNSQHHNCCPCSNCQQTSAAAHVHQPYHPEPPPTLQSPPAAHILGHGYQGNTPMLSAPACHCDHCHPPPARAAPQHQPTYPFGSPDPDCWKEEVCLGFDRGDVTTAAVYGTVAGGILGATLCCEFIPGAPFYHTGCAYHTSCHAARCPR